jgi:cell division protein YceG involved in septum cleavage
MTVGLIWLTTSVVMMENKNKSLKHQNRNILIKVFCILMQTSTVSNIAMIIPLQIVHAMSQPLAMRQSDYRVRIKSHCKLMLNQIHKDSLTVRSKCYWVHWKMKKSNHVKKGLKWLSQRKGRNYNLNSI